MSKKKKAVKTITKKVEAKRKDPAKSTAGLMKAKNDANREAQKKVQGEYKNPGSMMRDLLLDKKFTDEEIFEKVSKAFPAKTVKQTYCNNWRHWINNLSGLSDVKTDPVERLYKLDGKLVKKSAMPKKKTTAKKQYTKETDPLNSIAGIDVHSNPKKKVLKKAIKKVATKKLAENLVVEKEKESSTITS